MRKHYERPVISYRERDPQGLPTILAVGLASAAATFVATACASKLVGDDDIRSQEKSLEPCGK